MAGAPSSVISSRPSRSVRCSWASPWSSTDTPTRRRTSSATSSSPTVRAPRRARVYVRERPRRAIENARPSAGGTIVDAHALKRATHVLAERLPHGKRENFTQRLEVLHPRWVVDSTAASRRLEPRPYDVRGGPREDISRFCAAAPQPARPAVARDRHARDATGHRGGGRRTGLARDRPCARAALSRVESRRATRPRSKAAARGA